MSQLVNSLIRGDRNNDPVLEWRGAPRKVSAFQAAIVFLVAIAAFALATYLLRFWFSGFIGFFLVLGSVSDFFFTTKYKIDSKGIYSRSFLNSSLIEWKNVRRIVPTGNGLLFSPFLKSSALDAFRGVRVHYVENRDQVIEIVGHYTGLEVRENGQVFA